MSRNEKRGRKRSTTVKSLESAALVSQEAGLPARGGDGPVSRPAWAPGDVDLPEPVRRAVAEIVEPAYRKLVAEVEDSLERSIGLTLVQSGVRCQGWTCSWGVRRRGNLENPKAATQKTRRQVSGIRCQ